MDVQERKFVIQKHTKGVDAHWDLMLESGDCLQTWRVDKGPGQILQGGAKAIKIFDHPLKFLSYEGVVNNGEGNVQIVDAGTYQITSETNDKIGMELAGEILKGTFTLRRNKDGKWQFGRG